MSRPRTIAEQKYQDRLERRRINKEVGDLEFKKLDAEKQRKRKRKKTPGKLSLEQHVEFCFVELEECLTSEGKPLDGSNT